MSQQEMDTFLKERMMVYCREMNMNFFQSAASLHLNKEERQSFAQNW